MTGRLVSGVLGVLVACLAFSTGAPPVADAQQASPPERYLVNVIKVRPEMLTEWQALQKNETIPALQKIGTPRRDAWLTVVGEGFEYALVAPIPKFADRDTQQGPIVRALGQEGAAAYNAKLRKMLVSQHSYVIVATPELSIAPPEAMTPNVAVLTSTFVAPGRSRDYESWVKADLLPAMKKAQEQGLLFSRTIYGGDVDEYVSVRLLPNFAALDQPPPTVRALGVDGAAKMTAKLAGIVTRTERRVLRYVPDLSFRTKTTSDER